ncbi:hypothetical protein WJX79_000816 [Trebouxia sp. C0005]
MDSSLQDARLQRQPAEQNDEPAVTLRPLEIIGDVSNAVLEYCAQGLDAMEECAASSLSLEQAELDSLLQGTAQLYHVLQTKLKQQLQAFEQYTGETCLHIPAGLMPAEVTLPQTSEQSIDKSERELDMQLASLREQILMTQREQRQAKQEIARLHQELVSCDSAAQLAAVTAASGPEKENLVEGASAIVTAALQLQPLLARAQKLRAKDQTSAFKCGDNVNAGMLAEGELFKQEALVNSLPTNRLRDLTKDLQGMLNHPRLD